jgi:SNF2 family DNA or RNA helicase
MLNFTLSEYQVQALRFALDNRYVGLFLPMGSGKTLISLCVIKELGVYPWLVVAPPSVAKFTWKDEVAKFNLGLRVISLDGTPAQRRKKLRFDADIYTLSVDLFKDMYNSGVLKSFRYVILDEASMFRSPSSKRHKAMRQMRKNLERLIELTGTPCPNGIYSIWGLVRLLDSVVLGKYIKDFQQEYFRPGKIINNVVVEWKPKEGAEDKIYEAIKPVCLSIPAPNLNITCQLIDIYVDMSQAERKLYNQLKKDYILSIGTLDITAPTAAVLAMKLQQMANGTVYAEDGGSVFIHSLKLEALKDLLLQADDNAIVLYNFLHDKDSILRLKDTKEFEYSKWISREQKVSVAHPQSMGYGLNLQSGGSIMIWYGITWNLELYDQAIKRLFRRGQTKDVRIYRILTRNTIDSRMAKALKGKESSQQALISAVMEEIYED